MLLGKMNTLRVASILRTLARKALNKREQQVCGISKAVGDQARDQVAVRYLNLLRGSEEGRIGGRAMRCLADGNVWVLAGALEHARKRR